MTALGCRFGQGLFVLSRPHLVPPPFCCIVWHILCEPAFHPPLAKKLFTFLYEFSTRISLKLSTYDWRIEKIPRDTIDGFRICNI